MIKTTNLDKYFNKGKSNSIHVINNTSIEFPQKGLVSLVGQSGSGKTTLLNAISGLDKAKGTIQFDDITIDKYVSSKWDKIRAHDIGYIFQNYYLLENKSVYENIAITLNMIGIVDKEEIDYRIEYVLKAVNMFRYRRKKASDLSGGQKQRIAIARALAKNPKVVIADEPTGNLDSKNSIEVMKMIKSISEERLVILVTHNTELANKYSDLIITLQDGNVISKEENTLSDSTKINYTDNNIYLGDLNKHETNNNGINLYSNEEDSQIELTIVKIDNIYYLKNNNSNIRLNVITPQSGIALLDGKREESIHVSETKSNFTLDGLEQVKTKRVKKRTLSLKEAIMQSFNRVRKTGFKSKIFISSLILLGLLISTMGHLFMSTLIFDDSKIYIDKFIYQQDGTVDFQNSILPESNDYIMFDDSIKLDFILSPYFGYRALTFESFLPISTLKAEDLDYGRMPENLYEVVADSSVLEKDYMYSINFYTADIYSPKELLNKTLSTTNRYIESEYLIVGVTNSKNKALYLTEELIFNLDTSQYDRNEPYKLPAKDSFEVVEGRLPSNTVHSVNVSMSNVPEYINVAEVVVDKSLSYLYRICTDLDNIKSYIYSIKGSNFVVVGYVNQDANLTNDHIRINYYHEEYYQTLRSNKMQELVSYGNAKLYSLVGDLEVNGFTNKKQVIINEQKEEVKETNRVIIIQSLIALGVSGLVFFFLVRSSITSRVKEISILRSLGISKGEVISLFTVEYIMLTLFTSSIGIILGGIMTNAIGNSFLDGIFKIRVTPLSTLFGIVLIFGINIIIGLIPVLLLLRKTPAQMLTNYDI